MSTGPADPATLLARIEEARALLAGQDHSPRLTPRLADPLPSLIEQCRALVAEAGQAGAEPVRTVHHMACTGGTVICKALGMQPNTVLLSEIDPLSLVQVSSGAETDRSELLPLRDSPDFAPTDLIRHLRFSLRRFPETLIAEVFLAALRPIMAHCQSRGLRLVLRDHAHSQFGVGTDVLERPTLRAILSESGPVRSIVTVRHPLDSYLSLIENKWLTFRPATLDEYARRTLAFLDAYEGVEIFRYEDFIADPEDRLQAMCAALEMPCIGLQTDLMDVVPMTGGSGRTGRAITPRPRRAIPEAVARACANSKDYRALCARLRY